MAMTKKNMKKRSYKKKSVKKTSRYTRVREPNQDSIYRFKRTVFIQGALQSGTNTALPGGGTLGLSFSLGQVNVTSAIQGTSQAVYNVAVPGNTEFTNLFQQYKIEKVRIKLVPSRNMATYDNGIPVTPGFPVFTTCLQVIDYDDNTAPTTVAPLQEHSECKIMMMDGIKSTTLYPKFIGVVTGAPGTTVAGPTARGFLDCSQPNIEHNGIKFGLIAEQSRSVDVYCEIFYAMKGSK